MVAVNFVGQTHNMRSEERDKRAPVQSHASHTSDLNQFLDRARAMHVNAELHRVFGQTSNDLHE